MRIKAIVSVFASICMMILLTVSVSATAAPSPFYNSNTNITLSLNYSSNGASCYAKIKGGNGTTSISNAEMLLTDKDGNLVKKWSDLSASGTTLIVSKTAKDVVKDKTYVLTITATVNTGSSSQTISDSITRTY